MEKLTQKMRATLEALEGYEDGSSSAEVESSGGTRSTLYAAVRKGWAVKYKRSAWSQKFYSTETEHTWLYRLTPEGLEALKP